MSESWLLVETSGRVGKLGLARSGAVARAADLDPTRRHARDLAATVGALLEAERLRATDLTGVMVSIGPGGYTGLRVGVMSAKALAYATGCRLVAVPTFDAIVLQSPPEARLVWVIADALQGQIYLHRFTRGTGEEPWKAADELCIAPADEWLNWAPPNAWMTGPGVKVYAATQIPQGNPLVPEADREPTVESLFQAGKGLRPATREELFALEPLYLRGSSAEEKAKANGPRG